MGIIIHVFSRRIFPSWRWWTAEENGDLGSVCLCVANKLSGVWLWWDCLEEFICGGRCGSHLRKFWNECFFSYMFQSQAERCRIKLSLLVPVMTLPSWVSYFLNHLGGGRLPLKSSKNSHHSIHPLKWKHLCVFPCLPLSRLPPVSLFLWLFWDVLGCQCDMPTCPHRLKIRARAVLVLSAFSLDGVQFACSRETSWPSRHFGNILPMSLLLAGASEWRCR